MTAHETNKRDRLCGINECHPNFLQRFANVYCFGIFYVLNLLFRGMLLGVLLGAVTTIEKRFNLKTREIGILFSVQDFGHVSCVVLLSYYGARKRKPLILGITQVLVALSIFLFTIPHFIFGTGNVAGTADSSSISNITDDSSLCNAAKPDSNGTACDKVSIDSTDDRTAYAIFALSLILLGATGSAYHVLGLAYLDDNVRKDDAPLLIGVTNSLPMLGPMLGYFLSAMCVSIYVDFSDTNLKPSDPEWIGAWWLGVLLTSILVFICAIPLMLFPKTVVESEGARTLRRQSHHSQENVTAKLMEKPAELIADIWKLVHNKVFIFLTLGSCLEFWQYDLYYMFLPKYGEVQFGLSPSTANVFNGLLLGFMTCGLFAGGIIMKRLKVQLKGYLLLVICGGVATATGTLINMFTSCPSSALAGNASISTGWEYPTLCDNCHCDLERYAPICASDNLTYFSPCHAGCTAMNDTIQPKTYTACSCEVSDLGWGTSGICLEECTDGFYRFLVVMLCTLLVTSPLGIAGMMARLRCVAKEQKPLALSLQSFLWSLFVFMPGPIVSGALVDTACLLWNKDKCDIDGSTGNCLLYDNDRLRYVIHGSTIVFVIPGIFFYVLALLSADGEYFRTDKKDECEETTDARIDHYKDTPEDNDCSKIRLHDVAS